MTDSVTHRAACLAIPEFENTPASPARVCIIDLGTNSFHAIIVDAYPNGAFEVVDRMKEMVRLGRTGLEGGRLPEEAMERGVNALRRIWMLSRGWDVQEYLAYATSAIREAENGGSFIRRVRNELGLQIRPISGEHEARIIYEGVERAVDMPEPTLIVDIGGGSVEFIVHTADGAVYATSCKVGAARMTERFISTDPISEEEEAALRAHLKDACAPVLEAAAEHGVRAIVGSSGTAESLARVGVNQHGDPKESIFQQTLSAGNLRQSLAHIIAADEKKRRSMGGVGPRRADQIVAGALLIDVLIEQLPVEQVRVSSHALREGMVVHYINENYERLQRLAPFVDVRERSVYEMGFRFDWEVRHAQHVAATAQMLFDACKPLCTRPEADYELIEYAALLHDIGYHINHQQHPRHSQYLIEHADLRGFFTDEVHLLANVVRYHHSERPSEEHPPFARLSETDQQRVREMAAILRVAEGLDRSHFQNVRAIELDLDETRLHLTIDTQEDPAVEIWGAEHNADLFEDTFSRSLQVEPGTVEAAVAVPK